jgi:hypothetical protein
VLKNKHQAVSQGVRRFGKRSPPEVDEHLQKPHNAGSRPQARFFNTLLSQDQDQRQTHRAERHGQDDPHPQRARKRYSGIFF